MFALQLRVPVGSIVCGSDFLYACWSSTNSHIIFSMPSNSMSGIPNSTGPSLGTKNNLHLATLSLSHNLTEQTPYFSMFELSYVLNTTTFNIFEWHWITIRFINSFVLYVMQTLLWLVLDPNLVNITVFMLSKIRYLVLPSHSLCLGGLVSSVGAHHLTWHHELTYHSLVLICCTHT